MNAFVKTLQDHALDNSDLLTRQELTTLQINLGNLCNQSCIHCHVEASPAGKNIMSQEIMDQILDFLSRYPIQTLDITGGAPELNPHFEYFVDNATSLVDEILVRSNLTILTEEGKEHLMDFYKKHKIHLIASLPCYMEKNVDQQRGQTTFKKSVAAIKKLNAFGYGSDSDLILDLVYNPTGPQLPPAQASLEKDYKKVLSEEHQVSFNRLITITNVPIKRFKAYLESTGAYEEYYKLLQENFNPCVVQNIMCRTFISVGYDGKLYDCDFNQALGLAIKDEDGRALTIDKLDPKQLEGKEILLGEHCLSCTAGSGSSCQGALEDSDNTSFDATKQSVQDYYGKILSSAKDLKTSACCTSEGIPDTHKKILSKIDAEILTKFYGCGSPIPEAIEGCTVLDLGCGTGRDVYLASALVGEKGTVIGVDMTDEQLDVAKRHEQGQMKAFGFHQSNVVFHKGYIEDLQSIGIADNSVDLVISNCVVNLSPDKKQVFKEIFRVLKTGGELFFSDVFADRRIPDAIKNDPIFYGECLGGALYIEDFRRILHDLGCRDYRIFKGRALSIDNEEMYKRAKDIQFYSLTIRAFKLDLEDLCEDYGQTASYLGNLKEAGESFILDDHHTFKKGEAVKVCGNTASMLSETRFKKYFEVKGNRKNHYGKFQDCTKAQRSDNLKNQPTGGCC